MGKNYRFCDECQQYNINDNDRIAYTIGAEINGEEFVSAVRLHMIHLDALILCEKEKATFICDDLFLEKLQVWQKSPILMFYLYCYNIIRIKSL